MVQFLSTYDSLAFSSELKEVQLKADKDITLTVNVDGVQAWNESYTPDADNMVRVYDIDGIVTAAAQAAVCQVMMQASDGDARQQVNFTCLQCRARVNMTAQLFAARFFLTANMAQARTTAMGRRERFYVWTDLDAVTVDMVLTYVKDNAKVTRYETVTLEAGQQVQAVDFNPDDWADGSRGTLCKAVFSAGDRLLEFFIDPRRDMHLTTFTYDNIFGLEDFISFTGIAETETQAELEIGTIRGRHVNYDPKAHDETTIHSGYLSGRDLLPYKAFLTASDRKLLNADGSATGIVLTAQEIKHSTDDTALTDFTVTFRRDDDSLNFTLEDAGIFDNSFDLTFE